jgi:hypothetical protein
VFLTHSPSAVFLTHSSIPQPYRKTTESRKLKRKSLFQKVSNAAGQPLPFKPKKSEAAWWNEWLSTLPL